jgi:uncharacterized protein
MSAADKFLSSFRDALKSNRGISKADRDALDRELNWAVEREAPPTIAIIGETGVGKTTTLNSLFNAGAEVGHSRATTKKADSFEASIFDHSGNKGKVRVLDLPGLGESIAKSEAILEIYKNSLPMADVILWVHPAADRMLEFSQRQLSLLFGGPLQHMANSVVFGLNKADDIYPTNWRRHANIPSDEQLANLADAEQNFRSLVQPVLPSETHRVITYSALQRYNLSSLFALLMEAMPPNRRWVLERRMDLADFLEKADQRFVQGLRPQSVGSVDQIGSPIVPSRSEILAQMTSADKQECFERGVSAEDWWRMRGNDGR